MPKNRKGKNVKRFYSFGRVKRGPAPIATLTTTKYRKALPELRRDFEDRCAYCMRHIGTATEMEVDHFDPRRKKDKIQVYANLFLSDGHCNGAKSDKWPTAEEEECGCRFLNCCDEQDYNKVIFEDPETHELVGTTPAAIYHIETIDLNDPDLIAERKHRYDSLLKLKGLIGNRSSDPNIANMESDIAEIVRDMIPPIDPPPGRMYYYDESVGIVQSTK